MRLNYYDFIASTISLTYMVLSLKLVIRYFLSQISYENIVMINLKNGMSKKHSGLLHEHKRKAVHHNLGGGSKEWIDFLME
ncbi:MAG TPA: hypothetical protein DIT57_08915 [Enterococcus sp.]|uniref:hypothetical protein n=1 Tax=Enterococcus sp. RIT-PI-f TaxID=1690244 RepID=UPI000EE7B705|nr:hypothetical protein [Enterococcus sp.]